MNLGLSDLGKNNCYVELEYTLNLRNPRWSTSTRPNVHLRTRLEPGLLWDKSRTYNPCVESDLEQNSYVNLECTNPPKTKLNIKHRCLQHCLSIPAVLKSQNWISRMFSSEHLPGRSLDTTSEMHDTKRRNLKLEKWCDDVDPKKNVGAPAVSSRVLKCCILQLLLRVQAGLRPAAGCGIQVPEEGEQLERCKEVTRKFLSGGVWQVPRNSIYSSTIAGSFKNDSKH